ncbi:MAG: hypothetical protein ACJASQ_001176 [Crocinitomicaceae bacterium]|jgi:hypothetical protein
MKRQIPEEADAPHQDLKRRWGIECVVDAHQIFLE